MKISVVIPSHNEEERIAKTLNAYTSFFNKKLNSQFNYEILVVINATTDRTESIISNLSKKNKRIKFINLVLGGKGFALIEGFKNCLKGSNSDLIGFVDADMATGPESFFKLVEEVKPADAAIANRYLKNSEIHSKNLFRRVVVSRVFNIVMRFLFLLPYTDTQCGAKVFKKEVIKKILPELTITNWAFDVNLLYLCKKNNLKVVEVPTVWYEIEGSKIRIVRTSLEMLFSIIQLRILRSPFNKFLKFFNAPVGLLWRSLR